MMVGESMLASLKEWPGACCLSVLLFPSLSLCPPLSPSCPASPLFIAPRLSKSARETEPSPFCHLQR